MISIIIQLTTEANCSADTSSVKPKSLLDSKSSALASSTSNFSIGILPDIEAIAGNRPGAPNVRSLAKSKAKSGAIASFAIRFCKSISRAFFLLEKKPLRFFFFLSVISVEDEGAGVLGLLSIGFSSLEMMSGSSSPPSSSSSFSSLIPSKPIIKLNCLLRSSSSACLSAFTFCINANPAPPTPTTPIIGSAGLSTKLVREMPLVDFFTEVTVDVSDCSRPSWLSSDVLDAEESSRSLDLAEASSSNVSCALASFSASAAFLAASFSALAASFAASFSALAASCAASFSALAACFAASFSAFSFAFSALILAFSAALAAFSSFTMRPAMAASVSNGTSALLPVKLPRVWIRC
mmetsp:Transcript_5061/g.9614  ORF Transcript_5061/g.9614 Transcript_5061/m.9614 type:complete len:352 (-) Transcript_5061:960-2015(-)